MRECAKSTVYILQIRYIIWVDLYITYIVCICHQDVSEYTIVWGRNDNWQRTLASQHEFILYLNSWLLWYYHLNVRILFNARTHTIHHRQFRESDSFSGIFGFRLYVCLCLCILYCFRSFIDWDDQWNRILCDHYHYDYINYKGRHLSFKGGKGYNIHHHHLTSTDNVRIEIP